MHTSINGFEMSYLCEGDHHNTPIIFIHGFPFNKSFWTEQISYLKDNFYCISYDVRGHGESRDDAPSYNIDLFVDDLFGLMDYLKLPKAIICGLSMGGYIALRAYERFPDIFISIILAASKSEPDTIEAKTGRLKAIHLLHENGIEEYAENSLRNLFSEASIVENTPSVIKIRNIILQTPISTIEKTLLALAARSDTSSVLSKINVPALIIGGTEDRMIPMNVLQNMGKQIPHASVNFIPHTAHLVNCENPIAFNELLKDFLMGIK